MSEKSLQTLRRRIEDLDRALLKLLNERATVSVEIGRLKAENSLGIYDRDREASVFSYLADQNEGPLSGLQIRKIFGEIIGISRELQSLTRNDSTEKIAELSGTTSIYGILGNPVAHSMSPLMHNAAFRRLGINALYLPFEIEDLEGALVGMKALGIKGASVTHPFKRRVLSLIDEIDGTARTIGAVNTLVFAKGGVRGTNTDWVGAVKWLEALLPIEGHRFVVLGAGGAARAVVFGVVSKGGRVAVLNRSAARGKALADEFGCEFVPFAEVEKIRGDCLINTTPVGMFPNVADTPVSKSVVRRFGAVADVIYNPLKTLLLTEAEAEGCKVASGFEMFLFQGTEQFAIWTGEEPPVALMREVVLGRLRAL